MADKLRIKELKLIGKNLYMAEYQRNISVVTKPYEAENLEDAKNRAWDAEAEHESEEGGYLHRIKNLSTGEVWELG